MRRTTLRPSGPDRGTGKATGRPGWPTAVGGGLVAIRRHRWVIIGMHDYLRLMRPAQWVKNIIVLAGPAFGLKLLDARTGFVLIAFCLVASASYAVNDVLDREADKAHPTKRKRPVASGAVSPAGALVLAAMLAIATGGLVWFLLPPIVAVIVGAYFLLILAYSVGLKNRPILDVIVIAIGFVLRAVGGAQAVGVFVSPWLVVCTFTLCMFLGFGKRRCELATFRNEEEARAHRSTLVRYTPELLNHLTSVSAGIAIMTFLMYTLDNSTNIPHPPFTKEYLLFTLPLVVYALFRCAMLTGSGKFSGPTEIVLKDRALILTGILWVMAVAGVIHFTLKPESPDPDSSVVEKLSAVSYQLSVGSAVRTNRQSSIVNRQSIL